MPTIPCYLLHFQIFHKIDGFPKKFLNVFRLKKSICIFEELSNSYLIVLPISFFPVLLRITAENRTELKKLFINTTSKQTARNYSSATAIMREIHWNENDFGIVIY